MTRLVAALVLAAMGGMTAGTARPIGLTLIAIGLCGCLYQGVQMWRERRDPYDLSRLWEAAPVKEEPEDDDKFRNMILCHRCGASMSSKYSICPQCGVPLGQ